MTETEKNIVIEIINPFINDVNLNQIDNKNYSTKRKTTGLGLNHIKNLNKKIKVKKEIIYNLFKVSIILKK